MTLLWQEHMAIESVEIFGWRVWLGWLMIAALFSRSRHLRRKDKRVSIYRIRHGQAATQKTLLQDNDISFNPPILFRL